MRDDTKRLIGQLEEDRVYETVAKLPGIRATYRNLCIPNRGGSAEIDLLLLSDRAVIIVESKGFSGVIKGSATRWEWSRSRPPGSEGKAEVTHFLNPFRQVQTQRDKLSCYLGIPVKHISGLVVFSTRATLKKVPSRSGNIVVLQTPFVRSFVKRHLARRECCFTPAELDRIVQRLDAIEASEGMKKLHIIRAKQAERARKEQQARRREARQKPRGASTSSKR